MHPGKDPVSFPRPALIPGCLDRQLPPDQNGVATAELRRQCGIIHNGTLVDAIPRTDTKALLSSDGKETITHYELSEITRNLRLPLQPDVKGEIVVAIALDSGPLLAATCFAVAANYVAAPINASVGVEQFRADVLQLKSGCILTTQDLASRLQVPDQWTRDNGISVFFVELNQRSTLCVKYPSGHTAECGDLSHSPNTDSDVCLLLFTSGTSGVKKVVPITTHAALLGSSVVVRTWGLSENDICLNMMPLHHVGGLVRNIFAPILSGGSTICCESFDPDEFWRILAALQPTWYYASPTMHSVILSGRPSSWQLKSPLRLICNAAGGLLPSLAEQLRDVFSCTILPSYGMTECMPISTPPLSYTLERSGTSGVATDLDLAVFDGGGQELKEGSVGRICVRGGPLFHGYRGDNGELDTAAFTSDGWFDTGDIGYLDSDGYLFITGRGKEVINRGGETISPFEVENAIMTASSRAGSPIFGRVSQSLAFAVPHIVLQEVVGVILVTPPGKPRVDTRMLHKALHSSLQPAKWPALVVYANDLPRKNNKLLRIRLGERLGLPELSDDTPFKNRHWEAMCPPSDTDLSMSIFCRPCRLDVAVATNTLKSLAPGSTDVLVCLNLRRGMLQAILAPSETDGRRLPDHVADAMRDAMYNIEDNYLVPEAIHVLSWKMPRNAHSSFEVDGDLLDHALKQSQQSWETQNLHSTQGRVRRVFASVLQCDIGLIRSDAEFLTIGGDSLKAGKLLAALRSEFGIGFQVNAIFQNGTPAALARYIEENADVDQLSSTARPTEQTEKSLQGCSETFSSTRLGLLLLQLIPMVVVYPSRRALQWTIFMVSMSATQHWPTNEYVVGRLINLTLCIAIAQLGTKVIMPWFGIAAKWVILGQHREGMYPMWGPYHTRWWLTQKIVSVCGEGAFGWSNYTRIIYCRLMGATIGKNVTLKNAALGEWDLVEIHDGAVLDHCICRPFAGERNTTMYLGKIVIGRNASVGLASIVAPGTSIPDETCIGPNSSSWELDDATEANRDYANTKVPKPHWLLFYFVTAPLMVAKWVVSLAPWYGGLVGLVMNEPLHTRNPLMSIVNWFAASHRVGYHYLALVLRTLFSPFIAFAFVVVLRLALDLAFGKLEPSQASRRSQLDTWRMALIKSLLPVSELHRMTELLGKHYGGTSLAIRWLGGKVGKRVYWPGTGPAVGDYHLLDIGDDVVFGSRSHLVTSDGIGSDRITVSSGAMIADRVILMAGVVVGQNATLGTGSLTKRGKCYPPSSTYVGSQHGDAVSLSSYSRRETAESSLSGRDKTQQQEVGLSGTSPFGRAFYLKQAPYHVFGPFAIFCYSSFITAFTAIYWNVPTISSIQIVDRILQHDHRTALVQSHWFDIPALFFLSAGFMAILTTLQAVIALGVIICSKWILLGRRQPGNYDWDKSPYCQRWQIFLAIERLRRNCYRGKGILGMLTGTHWLVLYYRALGARIGCDCAIFANGEPSLYMTEPDLVDIGDRVVIDDASVVAHINTRGKFDLNQLHVGDRCVLRTGSRLLSGASMRSDSCLLEHTLVMGGDVVESGTTLQGWPSRVVSLRR